MPKEIAGINKEGDGGIQLSTRDIFVSDEHTAFTRLGSRLYGLFVVHKEAITEARDNKCKTSEMLLEQMIGEETEERYLEAEKVWDRRIPRDKMTSDYLTEQVRTIIKEHSTLLTNGFFLKKR